MYALAAAVGALGPDDAAAGGARTGARRETETTHTRHGLACAPQEEVALRTVATEEELAGRRAGGRTGS